jgi:hypothetical protein
MSVCIVCSTEALRVMPMNDKEMLATCAREFIEGMILARVDIKGLEPPRRGTCIVERCARAVEEPCGRCRKAACQRCVIAAELRAAEGRINADRDAELAERGLADEDIEVFIDKMVSNVCTAHAPFGAALSGQWYSRRSFLVAAAPHGP